MFTAVTFTRFMLRRASDVGFLAHKNLYGMNKKQFLPNFNYLNKAKIWYIIALLIIVPGLVSASIGGLNFGIDFTGGSIVQIQYEHPVELAEVREIVSAQVEQTPSIQAMENNQFQIRTEELTEAASEYMITSLQSLGSLTVLSTERIGPIIGAELLRNTQWAVLIAIVLLLAYITLRFQFHFALAAIIGLVHDVLVVISIFAIFRIEIDSSIIAGILTVLGYSINNTIVVFDRIRENVQSAEKLTAKEVINQSINQTLTRSINTVATMLFVLFALLFFGGETTRNFILALTIGVLAGFYSSLLLIGSILEQLARKTGLIVGKSRTRLRSKAKPTEAEAKV
jgi:preprotein translocase subunit SecF